MKKIFNYILLFVAVASSTMMTSCCDKDGLGGDVTDQMFMTQFRKNHNTGFDQSGDSHPDSYCQLIGQNTILLSWYLVNDCAGYEIKWAEQIYVNGGKEAWETAEAEGNLAGDTIIADPNQYSITLKNLPYDKSYYWAIRVLHSLDKNDPKNSKWYGYGSGHEWADYYNLATKSRDPEPPSVVAVPYDETTTNSITIKVDRRLNGYTAEQIAEFEKAGIEIVDGHFKIDYLTVTKSPSTPKAYLPETVNGKPLSHYEIPEDEWINDQFELTIEDLTQNSYYNVDVWNNAWEKDPENHPYVDACYNSLLKHTKGMPGQPIVINHVEQAKDTIGGVEYDISQYHSCKLDSIITNYCKSTELSENQVYYLEGGKAYHFSGNCNLYKGLTLATRPQDLAEGKRAILYLSGMTKNGGAVNAANFMIGRQPKTGENSSITLDIDSVRFKDLDVQVPLACNAGDALDGTGNAVGNYFMNMYSNGMGINVTLLEWDNCTFQGLIRGFFRVQGTNDFYINNIKLTNCQFYNGGFYATNGGGYGYIYADMGSKTKSCILKNVEVANNVFYDHPNTAIITDANRNNLWDESVRWKINVHHNTIVNFNTQAAQAIINTRYVPGGSELAFHDNLIILTRDDHDANRQMLCSGWDTRYIQGGDGSDHAKFIIYNNYSTNDNLTNGQVFTANQFSATSNAPGKWIKGWKADGTFEICFPYGEAGLVVTADDISATELMESPNPKYFVGAQASGKDHHTDTGIQGLMFKTTDKVKNSAIYKNKIGAPMLYR